MYAEAEGRYVRLALFGWRVLVERTSPDDAVVWANKWNEHLAQHLADLNRAAATVMQEYTATLLRHGVPQATIDAAMEDMEADAGL